MRTLNYLLKNGGMTKSYEEAVAVGYVKTVLVDESKLETAEEQTTRYAEIERKANLRKEMKKKRGY